METVLVPLGEVQELDGLMTGGAAVRIQEEEQRRKDTTLHDLVLMVRGQSGKSVLVQSSWFFGDRDDR